LSLVRAIRKGGQRGGSAAMGVREVGGLVCCTARPSIQHFGANFSRHPTPPPFDTKFRTRAGFWRGVGVETPGPSVGSNRARGVLTGAGTTKTEGFGHVLLRNSAGGAHVWVGPGKQNQTGAGGDTVLPGRDNTSRVKPKFNSKGRIRGDCCGRVGRDRPWDRPKFARLRPVGGGGGGGTDAGKQQG